MTPEKAISNWGGNSKFLDSLAGSMKSGTLMQGAGQSFGFYSESAQDAYKAFQMLAEVAGYTQAQLDAAYNSLSPLAQKLLDSGKAAYTAEDQIRAMAQEIATTRDTMGLTEETAGGLQSKIDAMAASFGLSEDAARKFSNKVWGLSQDMNAMSGVTIQAGDAVKSLADDVVASMSSMANSADGLSGLISATGSLSDAMSGLASSASRASGATGGVSVSGKSVGLYHSGGWAGRRFHGGGEIPAWLLPGERVLSHAEIARMGGSAAVDQAAGGGGGTINLTVNVDGGKFNERTLSQAIVAKLAELQRRGRIPGVLDKTAVAI